jgi:DNA-binding transcriptional MocR family regulator
MHNEAITSRTRRQGRGRGALAVVAAVGALSAGGATTTYSELQLPPGVTTSWVSQLSQEVVADLITGAHIHRQLRRASIETDKRRHALLGALQQRGVLAHARTPPAVRVTTAQLLPTEVDPLADALADAATGHTLISH